MTEPIQAIMKHEVVYDMLTGEVLQVMSYTSYGDDLPIDIPAGANIFSGTTDPETFYFPGGVETRRPDMPTFASKDDMLADGVDTVVFDNLPVDTKVRVNGSTEYTVDDGVFEYSTGNPGEHRFKFTAFPYMTEELIVNASE